MAKTNKAKQAEERKVLTPEFRASHPHLFKPNAINPKDKPKYSITMLFPKSADLSVLKLAIKHAKIDEFGPNKNNWPTELESPVVDGDLPKYADKEGYKGHWVIKATSMEEAKPSVFDEQGDEVINKDDFYPGCYARAKIFSRVWEFAGKQGIQFILDGVQKVRDGKPLSSREPVRFDPVGAKASSNMNDDDDSDDEDFT